MRHYPQNSPQASARILSLAALADGHLCKVEIDVMDGLAVHEQLMTGTTTPTLKLPELLAPA
ncbi:MAG: hypothetical protein ACOVOX_09895, partial [Burkholderiaceae bacterium]